MGKSDFSDKGERRSTAEYPVLVAKNGPLAGKRWLIKSTLTIGREPECDVNIADRQVSRLHARVSLDGMKVILEDLGSKNGTYIRGKKIEDQAYLEDGDTLQIALVQSFAFYASDATMPMEDKPQLASLSSNLVLETKSRRVWVKGQELIPPLSVSQFRLLNALYDQPGKVISRDELIDRIWENEDAEGVSEEALDALIRRLRDRLHDYDQLHKYIITVRGHGIRLDLH